MADRLQRYRAGRALVELLDAKLGSSKPLAQQICELTAAVVEEASGGAAGVLTEQQSNKGVAAAAGSVDPLDGAAAVLAGCTLLSPRGKYDMGWFASHLLLRNKSGGLIEVPYKAIEHVVVLEGLPREAGAKPCLMIVLNRASQVSDGKNRLSLLLVQTNSKVEVEIPAPPACAHLGDTLSGAQLVVLCQLAGSMIEGADNMFLGTDASVYSSARGDFAVQCNIKAKEGYLFPLESAFAYVGSPSLFFRHADITAVELARATPSSSTFDVTLHLKDQAPIEFGQLDQRELVRFQGYLTDMRLPSGAEQTSGGAGSSKRQRVGHGASGPTTEPVAAASADNVQSQHQQQERGAGGSNAEESDEDDSDFDPAEAVQPAAKRRKAADVDDAVSEDIGDSEDNDNEGDEDEADEDEYESSDDEGEEELEDEDEEDDDE